MEGVATIDSCVIKDNVAADNYIFVFYKSATITNSYINNNGAQSIRGQVPVVKGSLSNGDELNLELYTTANCKAGEKQKIIVLKYKDYTKFALDFCETFNNQYNRGLPGTPLLGSYYISLANQY